MGRRPKQTFLQRYRWPRVHEKMFNITDYYRNSDQKYNKVLPHIREWPSSKKSTNNKSCKGGGEKEPSCNVGGNVNQYSHYEE